MEETKISRELVDSLKHVPINKFLVVHPEKIESGSMIQLAGRKGSDIMAGHALFVVVEIDEECKRVRKGDFIINKANSESMAEYKVLDKTYFMINEEDVAVVLRP